jgi:hypothetical protein
LGQNKKKINENTTHQTHCGECKLPQVESRTSLGNCFPFIYSNRDDEGVFNYKNQNCVFIDFLSIKKMDLKHEPLNELVYKEFNLNSIEISNKVNKLRELNNIFNKLLLNHFISQKELDKLDQTQNSCLGLFLLKKKFIDSSEIKVTQNTLNHIQKNQKPKRIEESIKYVFKKGIRFLQDVFRIKVYPGTNKFLKHKYRGLSPLKRFEYAFYGYYFGEIATNLNEPIERFFLPRHSKEGGDEKEKLILKTISQNYINYVKKSGRFVNDLKIYLEKAMVKEVRWNIIDKVRRMCMDWEAKLLEKGSTEFILWVKNNFENNTKCKLVWSSQEVDKAIHLVLDILNNN